jgi:hypothetical protein
MTKNPHWNPAQKQFLAENLGKITIEDIAGEIGRSPRAVRLFIHRHKLTSGITVGNNVTIRLLKTKFGRPEYFSPTKEFFAAVGINQKRWWDLFYGRKQIQVEEYNRLYKHFDVAPEDEFGAIQLSLFD